MPPKEETTGLLSKVVKFVRNPTTNWADLDQQETDRESSYSKQMLKEMIERKRRNDFVRKREFDMLRKMRRSEVMAGQDPARGPRSSRARCRPSPTTAPRTLKKIDEIEAQMSMQWWKTKHGDVVEPRGSSTNFPMSSHMPPDAIGSAPGSASGAPEPTTRPQPMPPGHAAAERAKRAERAGAAAVDARFVAAVVRAASRCGPCPTRAPVRAAAERPRAASGRAAGPARGASRP